MIFLLILAISGSAIIAQYFNKKLLNIEPAHRVVNLMFGVCFLLTLVSVLFLQRPLVFYPTIFIVGAINAIAIFFFGRAVKISLYQTFILFPLTGVVPVIFSIFLFGERAFFDVKTVAGFLTLLGLLLTLSAASLFGAGKTKIASFRKWFLAVFIFFLIAGLANFMIKLFNTQNIAIYNYLFSWYSGSFLGSFLPRIVKADWSFKIRRDNVINIIALGVFTFISMVIFYQTLSIAPASLVFPIHIFLFVLGMVFIGLFVFKEATDLGRREWVVTVMGLVGAILLIFGIYK